MQALLLIGLLFAITNSSLKNSGTLITPQINMTTTQLSKEGSAIFLDTSVAGLGLILYWFFTRHYIDD